MSNEQELPLLAILTKYLLEGYPWIVFEGSDLHFDQARSWPFRSSIEALRFCQEQQLEVDTLTGQVRPRHLHYHAVPNLMLESSHVDVYAAKGRVKPVIELEDLKRRLTDKDIVLSNYNQSAMELAMGRLVSASKFELIVPANHLSTYYLLRHISYPASLGIENGSHLTSLGIYSNPEEAKQQFSRLSQELTTPPANIEMEILLVGQYKHTAFQVDLAGRPVLNTGFLLGSVRVDHSGAKHAQQHDPTLPSKQHTHYILGYDPDKKDFIMLDDQMRPTSLDELQISVVDERFRSLTSPAVQQGYINALTHGVPKDTPRPRNQQDDPDLGKRQGV